MSLERTQQENTTTEIENTSADIKILTPDSVIKLRFFDDVINLAVQEKKITLPMASMIKLTSRAAGFAVKSH